MQRITAGERLITYGIGVGFGLIAGLVGVGQWVLKERDLAARLAAFHAVQQRDPSFIDGTDIFQGNLWFWFDTAPIAAVAMLFACLLAAFTVCWLLYSQRTGVVVAWLAASESRRDGVVAAWVAAAVGGSIWVVATLVAMATTPIPDFTAPFVTCEALLGLLIFGLLIPLARVGTNVGIRARQFFSRGRRTL